ncbi:hypothetical protein VTI74DRAFT_2324 [Chaetomium olivicolor]
MAVQFKINDCRVLQPAMKSSRASRLFLLPGEIRNEIYRRVLVLAHPLYLFQDRGSEKARLLAPRKPTRWLALLYTNRRLHGEARAVLYQANRFALVEMTQNQANLLHTFLNGIGSINTGHLSHIFISFPAAEEASDQAGEVILKPDSLQTSKLLQEKCTSLTTLETSVHCQNFEGLTATSYNSDNFQFAREMLSQVNAHLKAIPSLGKVLVQVYSGPLTPAVVKLTGGFGWEWSRLGDEGSER